MRGTSFIVEVNEEGDTKLSVAKGVISIAPVDETKKYTDKTVETTADEQVSVEQKQVKDIVEGTKQLKVLPMSKKDLEVTKKEISLLKVEKAKDILLDLKQEIQKVAPRFEVAKGKPIKIRAIDFASKHGVAITYTNAETYIGSNDTGD